jgi:hypothetical protein
VTNYFSRPAPLPPAAPAAPLLPASPAQQGSGMERNGSAGSDSATSELAALKEELVTLTGAVSALVKEAAQWPNQSAQPKQQARRAGARANASTVADVARLYGLEVHTCCCSGRHAKCVTELWCACCVKMPTGAASNGVFHWPHEPSPGSKESRELFMQAMRNLMRSLDDHFEKQVGHKRNYAAHAHLLDMERSRQSTGLAVGRAALGILQTAQPYTQLPAKLIELRESGVVVGDLNHSPDFMAKFAAAAHTVAAGGLQGLIAIDPATNHYPVMSVTADGVTLNHTKCEAVACTLLVGGKKQTVLLACDPVPADEGTAADKARHIFRVLLSWLPAAAAEAVLTQCTSSLAFDGEYISTEKAGDVPSHIRDCINTKFHGGGTGSQVSADMLIAVHDESHKLELIGKYVRGGTKTKHSNLHVDWYGLVTSTICELQSKYTMGKKHAECKVLASELRVTFLQPEVVSHTRWMQAERRLVKNFLRNLGFYVHDMEKTEFSHAAKGSGPSSSKDAIQNRSKLCVATNVVAITRLLLLVSVQEVIKDMSLVMQTTNSLAWEDLEHKQCFQVNMKALSEVLGQGILPLGMFKFLYSFINCTCKCKCKGAPPEAQGAPAEAGARGALLLTCKCRCRCPAGKQFFCSWVLVYGEGSGRYAAHLTDRCSNARCSTHTHDAHAAAGSNRKLYGTECFRCRYDSASSANESRELGQTFSTGHANRQPRFCSTHNWKHCPDCKWEADAADTATWDDNGDLPAAAAAACADVGGYCTKFLDGFESTITGDPAIPLQRVKAMAACMDLRRLRSKGASAPAEHAKQIEGLQELFSWMPPGALPAGGFAVLEQQHILMRSRLQGAASTNPLMAAQWSQKEVGRKGMAAEKEPSGVLVMASMLTDPALYVGCQWWLWIFSQMACKNGSESYIESSCSKLSRFAKTGAGVRRLTRDCITAEASPAMHTSGGFVSKALDIAFGARRPWHFKTDAFTKHAAGRTSAAMARAMERSASSKFISYGELPAVAVRPLAKSAAASAACKQASLAAAACAAAAANAGTKAAQAAAVAVQGGQFAAAVAGGGERHVRAAQAGRWAEAGNGWWHTKCDGAEGEEVTMDCPPFEHGCHEWFVNIEDEGGGCAIGVVDEHGHVHMLGCDGRFYSEGDWQEFGWGGYSTGSVVAVRLELNEAEVDLSFYSAPADADTEMAFVACVSLGRGSGAALEITPVFCMWPGAALSVLMDSSEPEQELEQLGESTTPLTQSFPVASAGCEALTPPASPAGSGAGYAAAPGGYFTPPRRHQPPPSGSPGQSSACSVSSSSPSPPGSPTTSRAKVTVHRQSTVPGAVHRNRYHYLDVSVIRQLHSTQRLGRPFEYASGSVIDCALDAMITTARLEQASKLQSTGSGGSKKAPDCLLLPGYLLDDASEEFGTGAPRMQLQIAGLPATTIVPWASSGHFTLLVLAKAAPQAELVIQAMRKELHLESVAVSDLCGYWRSMWARSAQLDAAGVKHPAIDGSRCEALGALVNAAGIWAKDALTGNLDEDDEWIPRCICEASSLGLFAACSSPEGQMQAKACNSPRAWFEALLKLVDEMKVSDVSAANKGASRESLVCYHVDSLTGHHDATKALGKLTELFEDAGQYTMGPVIELDVGQQQENPKVHCGIHTFLHASSATAHVMAGSSLESWEPDKNIDEGKCIQTRLDLETMLLQLPEDTGPDTAL